MNIQLNENYLLTSDSYNVILKKKRVPKEGNEHKEPVYDIVGFYGSLEAACNGYLNKEVNMSNAESIEQLVEEVKAVREAIAKMTKGLKL